MSRSYCNNFRTALAEGHMCPTRKDKLDTRRHERTAAKRAVQNGLVEYYSSDVAQG